MTEELDVDQCDPKDPALTSTESDKSAPSRKEPYVDQEMADAYGFTPQQAKEMGMYL